MPVEIESILRASELRYSKDVDPENGETYSIPFASSHGTYVVNVTSLQDVLGIGAFLRTLDSIALLGSTRDLLKALLRLNCRNGFARVALVSGGDEAEWIIVEASLPSAVTPQLAQWAIQDTAWLAQQVLDIIAAQATPAQQHAVHQP